VDDVDGSADEVVVAGGGAGRGPRNFDCTGTGPHVVIIPGIAGFGCAGRAWPSSLCDCANGYRTPLRLTPGVPSFFD